MSRAECSDCTRVFICGGRNVPTVRNDPRTGEEVAPGGILLLHNRTYQRGRRLNVHRPHSDSPPHGGNLPEDGAEIQLP